MLLVSYFTSKDSSRYVHCHIGDRVATPAIHSYVSSCRCSAIDGPEVLEVRDQAFGRTLRFDICDIRRLICRQGEPSASSLCA